MYAGIGLNIQNNVRNFVGVAIFFNDFINIDEETFFWEILDEESKLIDEFLKMVSKISKENKKRILPF